MTYSVVPDKAVGDVFTEVMWDQYIRDNQNIGSFRPVADTTLGGTATNITFSVIPASYAVLAFVLYARGDSLVGARGVNLRFNGDTGSNYDTEMILGQGGTSPGTWSGGESIGGDKIIIGQIPCASAPANTFGALWGFIPYYANATEHKNCYASSYEKHGTTANTSTIRLHGGQWRSTAAITSVQILMASGEGNMIAGTRATLYGIGGLL